MNSETDQDLLRAYAESGSEPAFAELVRRHIDLVYSAALRMVRDPHLADDVSQVVFAALARSAELIKNRSILAGWLHGTTRNAAANAVRTEARRRAREREAAAMNDSLASESKDLWETMAPHLDSALGELREADREVILLRYFSGQSSREMAARLSVSAEAAQKRVNRAVERLREVFAARGITAAASALAATFGGNAVQSAPVGLTASICASLAGAAAQGTSVAATKLILMTATKKIVVTTALAAVVGTGFYQSYQASRLRDKLTAIEVVHAATVEQQQRERGDWEIRMAALADENAKARSNAVQLASLRGELSRLRQAKIDIVAGAAPEAAQASGSPATEGVEVPRSSWADSGFSSPQAALRTRGWCVLNGDRERFKESMFVTPGARKALEDLFVKMAEASTEPNKEKLLEEIIGNTLGVEEAFLMPMMAENQRREFTGYRILSQKSPGPEEMTLELETTMASESSKKEQVKLRRIGSDWKVVIDEEFLAAARL